jgi:hypothetical protein
MWIVKDVEAAVAQLWGTVLAFAWRDWENTTKNFNQDRRSPGWDLNPKHPEYEAGVLTS